MKEPWREWSLAKKMALFLTCYPERSRGEAWQIAGLSWDSIPPEVQLQLRNRATIEGMI